ncbi:MAG: Fis family transcriptional regulator [Desulfuromonas sp.]|nr:MAG: Fis family transcriptional regulator [Desulfuromonas sp.]
MSPIDPNLFFRDVTLTLCSSLDINVALHRCLLYLRKILPADTMVLGLSDPEACTLTHLAIVTAAGPSSSSGEVIVLPPEVSKLMDECIHDNDRLISDTRLDPLTAAVAPFVKNQGCSEILLPLRTRDDRVGYMVLQAKGFNLYREEQMRLMQTIREPLTIAMANAMRHQEVLELKDRLAEDNRELKKELSQRVGHEVVGAHGGLKAVMEMIQKVAPLQSKVLLLGETGTGKEVVANALHRLSPRRDGPFIKVNCGAIPETLIDSELFGYEKGAFSGADARKRGRFERADGGTLFLDEIGELPPSAQVRLLRVLQTQEIERVGATQAISVDIRVVAATHRNLEKMVSEGLFREDLWFRLSSFPVVIPPLRQRRQDIPEMIQYLLDKKAKELGLRKPPEIAAGAVEMLCDYPWPGNVRELENVVERALIQNMGRSLTLDSFALSQHPNGPLTALDDSCGCVFPCLTQGEDEVSLQPSPFEAISLDQLAERHIRRTLEATSGKIHGPGGAAELLGVNASTLRNRMNRLGISYGRKSRNTTS